MNKPESGNAESLVDTSKQLTSTSKSFSLFTFVVVSTLSFISVSSAPTSSTPTLIFSVDSTYGNYSVLLDNMLWFSSPQGITPSICVAGNPQVSLIFQNTEPVNGTDNFGNWNGINAFFFTSDDSRTPVSYIFKTYPSQMNIVVFTMIFPQGLNTQNCGNNVQTSTQFPAFDTNAGLANSLGFLTFRGVVLANTVSSIGLAALGNNAQLDNGPIVGYSITDSQVTPSTAGIVISTLDNHKIIVQSTSTPPVVGNISALWSSSRNDQLACLSILCYDDQQPNGNYSIQRVEGYGIITDSLINHEYEYIIYINDQMYPATTLRFAYSQQEDDNWVGINTTNPDSSYNNIGNNGLIFANNTAPNTIPLQIYNKNYGGRTDYAAVASPAGIEWATSLGYTFQYTSGYVWAEPPSINPLNIEIKYRLKNNSNYSTNNAPFTDVSTVYSLGVSAAIPQLPINYNYSVIITGSYGGPTSTVYEWGKIMQNYYNTYRLPSTGLTSLSYYTDDGAYYYVWEAFNIPARPWPAEQGLLEVIWTLQNKNNFTNKYNESVPISLLQLDDWWYIGKFYSGNVKSVTNWTASPAQRLFPNGLANFADTLDLPLQLYTPFWADDYATIYNMTESTVFGGTKLVTPEDSYAFFSDMFDLGQEQTNHRFVTYEIDFLDLNFAGSADMFSTVYAADQWYHGMANAALERQITIQYCLPSATDILESLSLPAVVQARASDDYVQVSANAFEIGGSALFMGALHIAPSKDTLWTSSPQPPTYSDIHQNGDYTTQPHVELDNVLAVLSLGPVGISDGIGETDVTLISQAYMSPTDGTLLRPNRPVSWVDSVFVNRSLANGNMNAAEDIRSTHAAIPLSRGGNPNVPVHNSHYVVAWQTSNNVLLSNTDLYPPPSTELALAVRQHIFDRNNAYQGCTNNTSANSCVTLLPAGVMPIIAATGTDPNLSNASLTIVYEPLSNGAYFLGELNKFVHVSSQRFDYILVGEDANSIGTVPPGPSGIVVGVKGTPGQSITLVAVDPNQIVHIVDVIIPESSFIDVGL